MVAKAAAQVVFLQHLLRKRYGLGHRRGASKLPQSSQCNCKHRHVCTQSERLRHFIMGRLIGRMQCLGVYHRTVLEVHVSEVTDTGTKSRQSSVYEIHRSYYKHGHVRELQKLSVRSSTSRHRLLRMINPASKLKLPLPKKVKFNVAWNV